MSAAKKRPNGAGRRSWKDVLGLIDDCPESKRWTNRALTASGIVLIVLLFAKTYKPWQTILLSIGLFLVLELVLILFHDNIVRLYRWGSKGRSTEKRLKTPKK